MTSPERLAEIAGRAYQHMTPWTAPQFAQTLAQSTTLLTSKADAFVLGQIIVDEAEILALAADPAHQRAGQASAALHKFHQTAQDRGALRCFLEVSAENRPALLFYAKHGYTEVGRRKGYYAKAAGPSADALIMARDLP